MILQKQCPPWPPFILESKQLPHSHPELFQLSSQFSNWLPKCDSTCITWIWGRSFLYAEPEAIFSLRTSMKNKRLVSQIRVVPEPIPNSHLYSYNTRLSRRNCVPEHIRKWKLQTWYDWKNSALSQDLLAANDTEKCRDLASYIIHIYEINTSCQFLF